MLIGGVLLKEKQESSISYREENETTVIVVNEYIGDIIYQMRNIMDSKMTKKGCDPTNVPSEEISAVTEGKENKQKPNKDLPICCNHKLLQ